MDTDAVSFCFIRRESPLYNDVMSVFADTAEVGWSIPAEALINSMGEF